MTGDMIRPSADWVGRMRTSVLAWWLPHVAMLAALSVPATARAAVWTIALIWMGTACILNARQCGRTHCRYTGPYYLVMVAPVLALGIASAGTYEWIFLGVVIVAGCKLTWWATERAWGKFS